MGIGDCGLRPPPLGAAGAAVHACALGNGFDPERATRLQVVVEELIREARTREAAPTLPGEVGVDVGFDGTSLEGRCRACSTRSGSR